MKKSILTLSSLFILAISITSCNKLKDDLFPGFDANIAAVTISIPPTAAGTNVNASSTVNFNLDSIIKANTANKFSINNLGSVTVKEVNVTLMNTDESNDVSNFNDASIQFASNGSILATIAAVAIPDTPATSLTLHAMGTTELKDILKGSQLTYSFAAGTRKQVTKTLTARVFVTIHVK